MFLINSDIRGFDSPYFRRKGLIPATQKIAKLKKFSGKNPKKQATYDKHCSSASKGSRSRIANLQVDLYI